MLFNSEKIEKKLTKILKLNFSVKHYWIVAWTKLCYDPIIKLFSKKKTRINSVSAARMFSEVLNTFFYITKRRLITCLKLIIMVRAFQYIETSLFIKFTEIFPVQTYSTIRQKVNWPNYSVKMEASDFHFQIIKITVFRSILYNTNCHWDALMLKMLLLQKKRTYAWQNVRFILCRFRCSLRTYKIEILKY